MYESFYGLKKKPFQITTDPSFLWMGKTHREALSTLKYGVMDNKGFLLLTGDVGTGKTTLINRLVADIKDRAYTAKVPDPGLSKYDFYRMVSRYFGLPIDVRTKSDFLEPFSRFLDDAYKEKKSVLLLIDEAQRLKQDLMEEIRLLSNLERQDAKLLNIFFVGQNEFNSILLQPENRALMRRITITYNLDPLNQEETAEYIRHRLNTAGAGYEIFSSAAMEEVYRFSNGFPRQINIISDLAMFFSSQTGQRTISRKVVVQCRERLSFAVDTAGGKMPDNVRAPAPRHHYRPPLKRRSRWLASPWRMAALILIVLITAAVCAPVQWKNSAGQWIGDLFWRYFERPAPTIDPIPRSDAEDNLAPISLESVDFAPVVAELPLLTPTPPPELHFPGSRETAGVESLRPIAIDAPPQEDDFTASTAETPDPGAAIDWLLKKR
ncbi:hypothetical protein DSCO28_69380 [Desulfosarcina ovata subsp. sediminis]|uniref:AAA+ ATPase domain-containing protein n=1 Tax=Desulfosarcina ovata subsp. sediminis TaxID=885957 RepID=A0A5K8A1F6_9BACT|nr:AAA family ATPase [Desulfosarcina ovata]BBO86372.1 hypothetical protein DSCO28_69380 [Desulfosarcina ovata subsp. sediminis]